LAVQTSVEFVTSAAGPEGFPRDRLAEVAMVGRSNVGKSSLINALTRRTVARTSAAPGKTRLANFYRVQRGSAAPVYLVDLPGYGYARGGGNAAREFTRLTKAYFARPGPRGVVLMVDARHPGLETDQEAWAWIQAGPFPGHVVATKIDKLTRAERERHYRALQSSFHDAVLPVSVRTGEGLEALWKLIATLPRPMTAPLPLPPRRQPPRSRRPR
jgi:GTP-binding protein